VTVCKVCAEAISLSKRPASCMESIWLCFCSDVEMWSLRVVTLKEVLCVYARNSCLLCSSAVFFLTPCEIFVTILKACDEMSVPTVKIWELFS
jgi:hypothetical protein